jgi:hypothetical protein
LLPGRPNLEMRASSNGRASAFQADDDRFESGRPLHYLLFGDSQLLNWHPFSLRTMIPEMENREAEEIAFQKRLNEALSTIVNKLEAGGSFTIMAVAFFAQWILSLSDEEIGARFTWPCEELKGIAMKALQLADSVHGVSPAAVPRVQ